MTMMMIVVLIVAAMVIVATTVTTIRGAVMPMATASITIAIATEA
jgi:hypothetical protein